MNVSSAVTLVDVGPRDGIQNEATTLTVAQKVELVDHGVVVERTLADGYEIVEATLPAMITVSNELGEPRYPTLRGIMTASRKAPVIWTADHVGLDPERLIPKLRLLDLYIPTFDREVEFIEGEDEADSGRKLALRLREEKLI